MLHFDRTKEFRLRQVTIGKSVKLNFIIGENEIKKNMLAFEFV